MVLLAVLSGPGPRLLVYLALIIIIIIIIIIMVDNMNILPNTSIIYVSERIIKTKLTPLNF